jgi:protoporphyrinogen oxidase
VERTKYLLIGGGITNLAFAHYLDSDNVFLCEALEDVGGYCRTVHQDGFVWDYSGHFFHFRHPEIEAELVARIGRDRVRKVEKESRIYFRGELIDFPFQKNIHQLPREDFLDCLVGLFEGDPNEPAKNFYEMLYRKFGQGISERFLVPYNEKLYATDLRTLDVDAMGRFFPHADRRDIILQFKKADNRSYNATFTYPEGGAIEYVRALQQSLPKERMALRERVLEVDLENKVARTEKRNIAFEYVISAVPFPALLSMTGTDFDRATYSYNKVLVFNLGFDRKGPRGLHWIYYPDRELSFYRVGFYDNIFDSERMSLYVEIGYPSGAEVGAEEIERMRGLVLADLEKVGVVKGQNLVSHHHVVLDPAYVHITRESQTEVARHKAILSTRGVYSMGRYGSWTYCSIEDNIVEARALAERFNAVPKPR